MGEYEPRDSRNITGTASTPDGRWTNTESKPPLADEPTIEEEDEDEPVAFEPAEELKAMIREGLHERR